MNTAARWIIERQENDGCWGGIQPPAVYSVIALHLLGYDLNHPVMRAGLESLDRFAVWREDGARMIEACQSPVWDTCLATIALADAGVPADHPQLVKAADWMLGEQVVRPGDWSVRRPHLPPGGWAFEFHNDNYPDIDDTAEVVLALRRVKHHDPERVDNAIGRGVRWNLGMQSRNGAWGAFDADNTSPFPNRLPFCDFGEVIDPPSADVTAVVERRRRRGRGAHQGGQAARLPGHHQLDLLQHRHPADDVEVLNYLNDDLKVDEMMILARLRLREGARPGALPGRGADPGAVQEGLRRRQPAPLAAEPLPALPRLPRGQGGLPVAPPGRSPTTPCSAGSAPAT
ncbi:hypothetical protein SALBM217S_04346 [Streptomyces griseoloalbus]